MTFIIKRVIHSFSNVLFIKYWPKCYSNSHVIILSRYKYAFVSLHFRDIFVSAYNNIAETCLESFIYPTLRNLFRPRTCLRLNDLYDSFRATAHGTKAVKMPPPLRLFRKTQTIRCSLTNRMKPRQWNNTGKSEIVIPPLAVSLKKIYRRVRVALYEIYIPTDVRATLSQVFHS